MRYSYGITAALLAGGAAITLISGYPAGAQVAQNDNVAIAKAVSTGNAQDSFAPLVAQLQPAVVNISSRQRITINQRNPFAGTPFAELFGGQNGGQTTRQEESLGSGFLVTADGYIVTNNHVINPPEGHTKLEDVTVTLSDGTEYPAKVVGTDPTSDLAVLKITRKKPFPFVRFGNSTKARVGDWVIAIGNPFGLGGTVTSGIISAVYRNTGGGAFDRYIQTDAPINRGNSGGPLFDMHGNVIGINNAIYSPSGGSVGIGFAIPASDAAPVVNALIHGQKIVRGYLGVAITPITDDYADALGIPHNRGAFIQSVVKGQAAAKAGLKEGDVVLSVDGKAVTKDNSLSYLVANIKPGTTVPLTYYRDGHQHTVNVTMGKRPPESQLEQNFMNRNGQPNGSESTEQKSNVLGKLLGVQVTPLTQTIANQLGYNGKIKGVVVTSVKASSDAAAKGLRRGTIITSANYSEVNSVADLERVVTEAKREGRQAILLRVRTPNGQEASIPVRLNTSTTE